MIYNLEKTLKKIEINKLSSTYVISRLAIFFEESIKRAYKIIRLDISFKIYAQISC